MKHKIILAVIGFPSLLPVSHSLLPSLSFKEIKPYCRSNFLLISFFFFLLKFLMEGELWCSISHNNIGICVTSEVHVSIILRKNKRACFALTKKKKSTHRHTFINELHFVSKKHFTLSAWL